MAGSVENQHPLALVNQSIEAVAAEVVQSIRAIRPQVVITLTRLEVIITPIILLFTWQRSVVLNWREILLIQDVQNHPINPKNSISRQSPTTLCVG